MSAPSWKMFLPYCAILASLPGSYALIGHGIEMYNPSCAFACRSAIASFPLLCSSQDAGHSGHGGHGGSAATTPECRASDTFFLQTLAWCMNEQCAPFKIEPWRLEKYWEDKATGETTVVPKWTYSEAFHSVVSVPVQMVEEGGMLNFTAMVDEVAWQAEKLSMEYFEEQETLHSRYGLVILITGFTIPIACSVLGYLPYTSRLFDKLNNLVRYPSSIGTYNIKPLPFLLGYAPTIGQSIYIIFFIILNIILTSVSYRSIQPNTWFPSRYNEILAYVSCRTGVFAFAISPLLILFSGRNNILLYITNWSQRTFLLLHRWIACVFALQCIVHSIGELIIYFPDHATESAKPYWIWGVVATIAVVLMLLLSTLYIRRASYELFLIAHIVLAVLVLVGSWYHVEYLFARKWGYQFWLYAAFGVWFFDRLIRGLRIWKTGIQKSVVRDLTSAGSGGGIVRIDIPGVRWGIEPGRHAYISFPTLSFRPWENHPFSIIPTALLTCKSLSPHSVNPTSTPTTSGTSSSPTAQDIEKVAATATYTQTRDVDSLKGSDNPPLSNIGTTSGITLFVRKSTGMTARLRTSPNLPILLEGPYHSSNSAALLRTDRLIVIAGGIGITAAFPYLHGHVNSKVYWSCREASVGLISEFDGVLGGTGGCTSSGRTVEGYLEKEVLVGARFDVWGVIEQEAAGLSGLRGRLGVLVCGPAGMCDDVRDAVVKTGRRESNVIIELCVDAFSW